MRPTLAHSRILAISACIWLAAVFPALAKCTTTPRAALPLTAYRGIPVVAVEINGHTLPFLLDTGAHITIMTPQAAINAQLPPDRRQIALIQGIAADGSGWNYDAQIKSFRLGDLSLPRTRIHIGDIISRDQGSEIAGILGADILGQFDLELDMPGGLATLHAVAGCIGDWVPWREPHDTITNAWANKEQTMMTLPASLNGRPIRSFIDTGATYSMLTRTAALAAGADDQKLSASPRPPSITDATGNTIEARQHQFPALQIGNEIFRKVRLIVCDCTIPDADLQIGQDYLSIRKTWLSYSTGTIFVVKAPAQ